MSKIYRFTSTKISDIFIFRTNLITYAEISDKLREKTYFFTIF